jgi:hypothetical protein
MNQAQVTIERFQPFQSDEGRSGFARRSETKPNCPEGARFEGEASGERAALQGKGKVERGNRRLPLPETFF